MSDAIHASFNSTFATFLMPNIDGSYSDNLWGKVTTAYPRAMFELLSDITLLNTIFYKCLKEGHAIAFAKTDFTESNYLAYYHFMKLYDYVFDFYYNDLLGLGIEIEDALQKAYKISKEMES